MPSRPLTPKQQAFVREYLVDLNASAAARRAGYSERTAGSIGDENLKKPEIRRAIDAALKRRAERVEVSQDHVLRSLLEIANVDVAEAFDESGQLKPIHEIPPAVRRAISGIEVDELFEGRGEERTRVGVTRKVKFWPKVQSLELLGKHLKLFVDRQQLENPDGSPLADALRVEVVLVDPKAGGE